VTTPPQVITNHFGNINPLYLGVNTRQPTRKECDMEGLVKVFILTIQLSGGFTATVMETEVACSLAIADLHPNYYEEAFCFEAWLDPGTMFAPRGSPIPKPRPPHSDVAPTTE
jgi:hypothetical protein